MPDLTEAWWDERSSDTASAQAAGPDARGEARRGEARGARDEQPENAEMQMGQVSVV